MDVRHLAKQDKPKLPAQERVALRRTRQEARKAGATLESNGEGGLAPSLALGVFRRCEWRCKKCGGKTDLSLHHIAHLENPSSKVQKKARGKERNDPSLITCVCKNCHDDIHDEDREESQEQGEEAQDDK